MRNGHMLARTGVFLGLAIAATVPSVVAAAEWQPGPAIYGIVKQTNLAIPMSDGATLLADVARPADLTTKKAAPGTFPVIVTITPYRKVLDAPVGLGVNRFLVERGYIHVIVDVRGTGASGGTFGFFNEREQQDGPEVVRWAAALPGSSGKVGMYGPSYLGITQLFTAARIGPDSPLKAIMPIIAAHDVYRDFAAPGGLFSTAFDAAWFVGVRTLADTAPPEDILTNPVGALARLLQHPQEITATTLPLIGGAALSGAVRYDGPYYHSRRPEFGLEQIVENGIPALLIGGWSDVFQRGEPLNLAGLQNAAAGRPVGVPMEPGQPVTGRYQLVQGPWFHLPAAIDPSLPALSLRWFDTWLKDQSSGMEDTTTPFHAFEFGSKRWVDVASYPFAEATTTTLYLRDGRTGSAPSLNDGALSRQPPASAWGEDAILFQPVGNPCSRQLDQWTAGAGPLVAALTKQEGSTLNPCLGDDRLMQVGALTYSTEPFPGSVSLAGPVTATLYVRSNTREAEIVVSLEDVSPDGKSYPLTNGYLLGSFRELDEAQSWFRDGKLVLPYHPFDKATRRAMRPGVVERLDVEVFPTLASFAPGHRLRVTITTSVTPELTPMPEDYLGLIGGFYRIQRSAAYPSHVNIPLVASSGLATSPIVWGGCTGSC